MKQNITRDIEIKSKLTVTRWWGRGIMGEIRGRVIIYKGHMDKVKGE